MKSELNQLKSMNLEPLKPMNMDHNGRNRKMAFALGAVMLLLAACKKDEETAPVPTPPATNEEEVITSLELHFHSSGGTEHKHFNWRDLDGAGGADPVVTADTLSADTVYMVEIVVLDESGDPVEDITAEIEGEKEAHQFFYQVSGSTTTVAYADADANGQPVGLMTTWTAGAPGAGTVTVILRHEPDKSAPGVSTGDITQAGGETDIETVPPFPLVIE